MDSEISNRPSWLERVEALASQIAEREGCRLYDLEFSSRTLRVYIDKEPSAGIKDCENVSRGLSLELDTEDIIPGEHYNLEVSTPGLERVLKKEWHYSTVIGKKIKVRTNKSLEALGTTVNHLKNTKSFEAELKSVDGGSAKFLIDEHEVVVPIDAIERARVVFEYDKGEKKSSKKQ